MLTAGLRGQIGPGKSLVMRLLPPVQQHHLSQQVQCQVSVHVDPASSVMLVPSPTLNKEKPKHLKSLLPLPEDQGQRINFHANKTRIPFHSQPCNFPHLDFLPKKIELKLQKSDLCKKEKKRSLRRLSRTSNVSLSTSSSTSKFLTRSHQQRLEPDTFSVGHSLQPGALNLEPTLESQSLEAGPSLGPGALTGYNWPNSLCCSSTGDTSKGEGDKVPDLEKVSHLLVNDLVSMFVHSQNWALYHPNMILEDNIRGKRYEGLAQYKRIVSLLKLTAHIRFVHVRFHILSLTKHPEDGTIRVRWRIAGLGMLRMILRYVPDKMWIQGNMNRAAPSWYDGVSTFHVTGDDLIYKHTVERVDREDKPVIESWQDKLKRLNPARTPLSPAL